MDNVSVQLHKCKAESGVVYTGVNDNIDDGEWAEVTLFFDTPEDMVDMSNLLLKLANELGEKQNKRS